MPPKPPLPPVSRGILDAMKEVTKDMDLYTARTDKQSEEWMPYSYTEDQADEDEASPAAEARSGLDHGAGNMRVGGEADAVREGQVASPRSAVEIGETDETGQEEVIVEMLV